MSDVRQHTAVWSAIDQVAGRRDLSRSGLAKLAGLDATAFNRSKRVGQKGLRWPSTETVAAVLAAADMTWADFGQLVDEGLG